jgi:hypothetical protein
MSTRQNQENHTMSTLPVISTDIDGAYRAAQIRARLARMTYPKQVQPEQTQTGEPCVCPESQTECTCPGSANKAA